MTENGTNGEILPINGHQDGNLSTNGDTEMAEESNGHQDVNLSTNGDTEMAEDDDGQIVTMIDVLRSQQEFEEDANAVLGGSDEKECTYSKGYIKRQAIYACMTCCPNSKEDESKRAGVCLACSLICHENHELIELYTKRNFRCDCGNPKFESSCNFTPNKLDLNECNSYNQNFVGLYCICNKPYGNDENALEDEMVQCIVCEDWWHASHLEAVMPQVDNYSEMICKLCLAKNDFLHSYSHLAFAGEDVNVDVVNTNGNAEANESISNDVAPVVVNGTNEAADDSEKVDDNIMETSSSEPTENVLVDNEASSFETESIVPNNAENSTNSVVADQEISSTNAVLGTSADRPDEPTEDKLEDGKDNPAVDSSEKSDETSEVAAEAKTTDTEKPEPTEDKLEDEKDNPAGDSSEMSSETNDVAAEEKTTDTEKLEPTEDKLEDGKDNPAVDSSEMSNELNQVTAEDKTTDTEKPLEEVFDKNTSEVLEAEPRESDLDGQDNPEISNTDAPNDDECLKESPKVEGETESGDTTNANKNLGEPPMVENVDSIERTESIDNENKLGKDNKEIEEDSSKNTQEPTNTVDESNMNIMEDDKHIEPETVTAEKRKVPSEFEEEDNLLKKPKLYEKCIRPKDSKKTLKGATFWPLNFRQKLCTCNVCIAMYQDLNVLFLTDVGDSVSAYVDMGKEKTNGKPNQYEKGMEALSSLGRTQQIDALTEYNKMRDKLLTFLQSFKERSAVVTENDIRSFFADMKPEKRNDGVYFCG